jgi:hypothetical protein
MIYNKQKNKINLKEIENWSKKENNIEKYNIFIKKIIL